MSLYFTNPFLFVNYCIIFNAAICLYIKSIPKIRGLLAFGIFPMSFDVTPRYDTWSPTQMQPFFPRVIYLRKRKKIKFVFKYINIT